MSTPSTPRRTSLEGGYGPVRSSDHVLFDPSIRGRQPLALPYGDPGAQVTAGALTRVMSPNDLSEETAIVQSEANQNLLGIQTSFQVCQGVTPDPTICAG